MKAENITVRLEFEGIPVELRGYVPHGIAARFQQNMFKSIKTNLAELKPNQEDLVKQFGEETIRNLDSMSGELYDEELQRLENEYAMSHMEMEKTGLENVEEANTQLIVDMIVLWDNNDATEEQIKKAIFELPESDYKLLLKTVNGIKNTPLVKKTSQQSEPSSTDNQTDGEDSK